MNYRNKYLLRSNTEETYIVYGLFDTLEEIKEYLVNKILPLIKQGMFQELLLENYLPFEDEYNELANLFIEFISEVSAEDLVSRIWEIRLQIDEITVAVEDKECFYSSF